MHLAHIQRQLIETLGINVKSFLYFRYFENDARLREGREYFAIIMRILWFLVGILLEIHLYFTGKVELLTETL